MGKILRIIKGHTLGAGDMMSRQLIKVKVEEEVNLPPQTP